MLAIKHHCYIKPTLQGIEVNVPINQVNGIQLPNFILLTLENLTERLLTAHGVIQLLAL